MRGFIHIRISWALVWLLLTGCLLQNCNRFDLNTYDFSDLPEPTAERLELLADTSVTLGRLEALMKHQQVDSLLFFAEWLKNYDEAATLAYAQLAYDLSTDKNWNVPRAISAYRLAWSKGKVARYGEDIEDAMVDARISRRLLLPYENDYWNMEMHYLFGYLFEKDEQPDSARHYFQKALALLNEIPGNSATIRYESANLLGNIATTYAKKDSLIRLRYFRQSDSLYQLLSNTTERSRLWLDQAAFYIYHKKYSEADSLLNLCLSYGIANQDNDLLVKTYQRKGRLYQQKFYYKEQIDDFELAVTNLKTCLTFDQDYHHYTYELLGGAFQDSWAIDIDESHIDSAIYYKKLAFEDARQHGAIKVMKRLSADLAYLCDYLGKEHEQILGASVAEFLDKNYVAVSDTITQHTKTAFRRINEVEQRDIRVSAANKRKNQLLLGIVILSIAAVGFLFFMQRAQNRRLKAEMKTLRAQINPHFISNSLNAIENLVNAGETKAASKYLVHFSRLSRQILTGSRHTTTSLENELKMLKHFLALEQLRFRDKLAYEIRLAEDIDTLEIVVPALILQPYVENAIWHGIKPKPEGGKVTIDIRQEKKTLVCTIEDDGIGRQKSQLLKQKSVLKHKSMGMSITEERLKAVGRIKGSNVEIVDLKDKNEEAKGTRVILRLALKKALFPITPPP